MANTPIEVIVKFGGDIQVVAAELGVAAEILSNNYAIMLLPPELVSSLYQFPQVEYVEPAKRLTIQQSSQTMERACITPVQPVGNYNLSGEGVVVAIIDSGIDYAHPAFIDEQGRSRILYIWDQNLTGPPPPGFVFGAEYTREQIDRALAETDRVRRRERLPHVDFNGHGTAVAGIAAGNGKSQTNRFLGAAPAASIICVKLRYNESPFYTSTTDLMRGVKYTIDKAESLNMPVAINLSYGTNDGSHDGLSLLEQFLDDMSSRWLTSIVAATGNEGMTGHHAAGSVAQGETVNVEFSTQPGLTYLWVIMRKSFVDVFSLEIISSAGHTSGPITRYTGGSRAVLGNVTVTLQFSQPTPYDIDQNVRFQLAAFPGATIPESIWTIRITGVDVTVGSFDLWLPVTEISGLGTACLDPSLSRTLTIPSTAKRVIAVGGYDSYTGVFAQFSGRGFVFGARYVKPDLVAPAVDVWAPRSGSRGYDRFTGTSMAAPHVTGSCALLMQWGIVERNDIFLYGQRLRSYLRLGANRLPNLGYPNEQWGFGTLCLRQSLDRLIRYKALTNAPAPPSVTVGEHGPAVPVMAMISPQQFAAEPAAGGPAVPVQVKLPAAQGGETPHRAADADPPIPAGFGSPPPGENPVTSEDYYDFMVNYYGSVDRLLEDNPNIYFSTKLQGDLAVAHVPTSDFNQYISGSRELLAGEAAIICSLADEHSMNISGITEVHNLPFIDLLGRGVLVGIVDTGIDYTSASFVYEDNTSKIASIWDQSVAGTGVPGFPYGVAYSQEQIDAALQSDNPLSVVPSVDEVGHGTFLAALAAGRGVGGGNVGAAPEAELVVVKLKRAKQVELDDVAIYTDAPAYQSTDIVAGIEYIYQMAGSLNRPAVIFLGIQTNEGAHDGLTLFERYLTRMSIITGISMITSVGNEGNRSHHATGRVENTASTYEIEMNVARGEPGFSMSIWALAPDRLSVSLTSPLGEVVERSPFATHERRRVNFVLTPTTIDIRYDFPYPLNGSQLIRIIFRNPTPGLWRIRVYGDLILEGTFHAWLPVSQFVQQDTVFLNSTTANTVTIPATSRSVISCGAYNGADRSMFISSGRGPALSGKQCPDLCAPGVNVGGVLPDNQTGRMTGTSVATAITAGAAALLMQWGIVQGNDRFLNTQTMRSYLILGCTQSPGIQYPDALRGYGELNLINSFRRIQRVI